MANNKKISDIGLEEYLIATHGSHNIQCYSDLAFYIRHKVPVSAIARMFNVNRKTAVKWIKIYKEENSVK